MNQIDHKDFELFRYYISQDIKRIEYKVSNDNSVLLGYFIGSVVDLLIVSLFSDCLNALTFKLKVLVFVMLVIAFIVISYLVNGIRAQYKRNRRASGKDHEKPEEVLRVVDEFDNIASDGLLLCEYYKEKYKAETNSNKKTFFLYEMLHYLEKFCAIYRKIYQNFNMYVNTEDNQLLSLFRVENNLGIAQELLVFIQLNSGKYSDNGFFVRVKNMETDMKIWREAIKSI